MTYRIVSSTCAAAILAVAASAAGQNAPQTPTQSPVGGSTQSAPAGQQRETGSRSSTENQVTVIGCVAREGDASSNQFVLREAMRAPAAGATASAGATTPGGGAAVGTTGAAGAGAKPGGSTTMSYALAGDRESSLASYVGQRVEIVGRTSPSAAGGGAAAGGAAAGAKPGAPGQGAQAGAQAGQGAGAKMPELEIVSVKPASGSCN